MRSLGTVLAGCCAVLMTASITVCAAGERGTLVDFRSGSATLRGIVYKPEGKGPFPVVVFERGHNTLLSEESRKPSKLADFYTSHGFVLFVTSRRAMTQLKEDEKGPSVDLKGGKEKVSLPEFEYFTRDVAAAVNWIKVQPYADENRVAVVGYGVGATISLFAAEQEIGVRAVVLFAPGAIHWNQQLDLHDALADAVKETKVPLFLIQAQNDFSLGPSQVLGKQIAARGAPSLCKVYPPFGTSNVEGNRFYENGMAMWGDDVVEFLTKAIN